MGFCARQQFRLLVLRHRFESFGEVNVLVQFKRGGSINGQVNETSLIDDSEEAWAGSGSADYRRATEVLSGRD
jgi:hypothetical protein